ncbi:MAG: hypothetical protein JST26_02010 [Bacteroidetes bacterium]|nr:hypothetical protein [Bacteroidota bacterium]
MKIHAVFHGLALLLAITLASCHKKDWTCTCVVTKSAVNGTYIKTISHKSGYRAGKDCQHYGDAIVAGAGDYDCQVK